MAELAPVVGRTGGAPLAQRDRLFVLKSGERDRLSGQAQTVNSRAHSPFSGETWIVISMDLAVDGADP